MWQNLMKRGGQLLFQERCSEDIWFLSQRRKFCGAISFLWRWNFTSGNWFRLQETCLRKNNATYMWGLLLYAPVSVFCIHANRILRISGLHTFLFNIIYLFSKASEYLKGRTALSMQKDSGSSQQL